MAPQAWIIMIWIILLGHCLCKSFNVGESPQPQPDIQEDLDATLMMNVIGCPRTCFCASPDDRHFYIRNCSSDPIDHLSTLIMYYPNLTHLEITNSFLSALPCELSALTQLTHLDLFWNNIDSLNCDLRNFTKLTSLNMSVNYMTTFPCNLTTLPHLVTLHLASNDISLFTCDPSGLKSLTTLDMSLNTMSSLPCELTTLPQITYLNLFWNMIETVQCDLSNLTHLTFLNLSKNFLRSVPSELSSLPQVTTLDLSLNQIVTLDSWLISLARRRRNLLIYLDGNYISTFTNHEESPAISCNTIQQPFIFLGGNNISHVMDILIGWNLNISTSEKMYDCLDILLPLFDKNPLNCDCVDYEIYLQLHSKNISYMNVMCYQPLSLRRRSPSHIGLDKFICDISDSCPTGCDCYDSPFYQSMNISCTNFQGATLPEIIPDLPKENYKYGLEFKNGNLINITDRSYLTEVSMVKFSNNLISDVSKQVFLALENVSVLYLDGNSLKRLPENITDISLFKIEDMKLGHNSWVCDCEILQSKRWMMAHGKVISDKEQITCSSPTSVLHKAIMYNENIAFCPDVYQAMLNTTSIIAVSITMLVLLAVSILISLRIRKWLRHDRVRLQMQRFDETDDMEFDIFVSYANEDEDYVLEYLIPELENHDFKVCFHRVHFQGGKTIVDNISECINKSKRTLAFFSIEYRDSHFCMWEFKEALNKDVREGTSRLIIIKDTGLAIESLDESTRAYFAKSTFIDKEALRFWDNLLYSLPRNRMGCSHDAED